MKRLFGLILFISAYLSTAFATTLTGTLKKPDGSGFTGTLYLSFPQQVGISSAGSCGGPILAVPTAVIAIPVNNGSLVGTWNVYGSDCTLPYGMPYNAILKDPQGNTMFSTQWLITGSSQDLGTVYQGPSPLPPTASVVVYGIGTPGSTPCSAQQLYVQTNGAGSYLYPCIGGLFQAQAGGPGSGLTLGNAVGGASPNGVLFADASSNFAQDASYFYYNSTSHILTATNSIVANITGNAGTASALASTPSLCTSTQVSSGIAANGTAQCQSITSSMLTVGLASPPPIGSTTPNTIAGTSVAINGTDVNAIVSQGNVFTSGALVGVNFGDGSWTGVSSPTYVGIANSYTAWGTAQSQYSTNREAEYRVDGLRSDYIHDWTSAITQGSLTVFVKNGTNDSQVHYGYVAVSGGAQSDSDEGLYFDETQGGQQRYGLHVVSSISTLANGQQTVLVSSSTCQSGWSLPFEDCRPSQGNRIWKDTGISGRITGVSAAVSGVTGCSSVTGVMRQFPTTMSLPIATAWGCATGLSIYPNYPNGTTPNAPVSETVTLTGGSGLLTTGYAFLIGSQRPENVNITAVSGSAGTQTVTFTTAFPTSSVFFVQGTHVGGGLGFVGTKSVTGLYDNYIYVMSVDGSTAIYTTESYSQFGLFTLPKAEPQLAVANPTFTGSISYTAGNYVFDGTNVQKVITTGTAGSTVTWATSCPGNATSGVGCTTTTGAAVFVNIGPMTSLELFDAARVTATNATDNGVNANPRWTPASWQIEKNQMSLSSSNSFIEPNFDEQRIVALTRAIQCLTPGGTGDGQCLAGLFQTKGSGNGAFQNAIVEMDNLNPQSLIWNYDGISTYTRTGVALPNQIQGFGYFQALNQEYYAPVGGLYNFIVGLPPGQTSFSLIGFGGGYHGSYTPGSDLWSFANVAVAGLTSSYCVQAGTGGLLMSTTSPCAPPIYTGTGTFTTATSDNITITGITSDSVCTFTPTNGTAAAATTVAYISNVAANTLTISHVATTANGGTVNILCK